MANKKTTTGGAIETIQAIASAWGCSLAWLANGTGQPEDASRGPGTEDSSNLRAVVARRPETSPAALALARTIALAKGTDLSEMQWEDLLRDAERLERSAKIEASPIGDAIEARVSAKKPVR